MFGRFRIDEFLRDKKGATMVYVSLMMALLVGFTGLAIDFSRLHVSTTQAQAAADAAAIAAANQLDGGPNAIARAERAAENASPLIENSQTFAKNTGGVAEVEITLRFLTDLPDDDDTPIDYGALETFVDEEAEFVEATTEILTHSNFALPALGIENTRQVSAVAIAGQDAAVCRITPFAICNPNEDPSAGGSTSFDVNEWIGKQIIVKHETGPNASWRPGNFGFLKPKGIDDENINSGAKAMGAMLAGIDGANQCFSTGLDMRTGQIDAIRSALNVRFDVYENPHFNNENNGGQGQNPVDFPPATNVTKGWLETDGCSQEYDAAFDKNSPDFDPLNEDDAVMGLPPDNGAAAFDQVPAGSFGDGKWDCADYWEVNHPDDEDMLDIAGEEWVCENDSSSVSRFEMYKWEVVNNKIPGVDTGFANEEGSPECYTGGTPVIPAGSFDIDTDRRIVHFAVMNCIDQNIHGSADDKTAIAFVRAFLTQPINDGDFNVHLEVVDVFETGITNGPLREYVEIYR